VPFRGLVGLGAQRDDRLFADRRNLPLAS
jgi:hypothetical protein